MQKKKDKKYSPQQLGAISEHIATAWLLNEGYDVFRNVAAAGRADLLAVDWVNDETIRVDVKSSGFSLLSTGPQVRDWRRQFELNKSYNIRYLIVEQDGTCKWYMNEDYEEKPKEIQYVWFADKKSGQRFHLPGIDMTKKEWSYFCHWVLENYEELITPFSEGFIRNVSVRQRHEANEETKNREHEVLKKFHKHIYDQLKEKDLVILKDVNGFTPYYA